MHRPFGTRLALPQTSPVFTALLLEPFLEPQIYELGFSYLSISIFSGNMQHWVWETLNSSILDQCEEERRLFNVSQKLVAVCKAENCWTTLKVLKNGVSLLTFLNYFEPNHFACALMCSYVTGRAAPHVLCNVSYTICSWLASGKDRWMKSSLKKFRKNRKDIFFWEIRIEMDILRTIPKNVKKSFTFHLFRNKHAWIEQTFLKVWIVF